MVKSFRSQDLTFPAHHHGGPRSGELHFKPLTHDTVLKILHNPAYAGVYSYGRARHTTDLDGHHHTRHKPAGDWTVLIKDHHPGYLTFAQYERNLQTLAANAAAHGTDRKAGPPREGNALLQGLVVCGNCGRRMTVRYHTRPGGQIAPDYLCQNDGTQSAGKICQHMPGDHIDAAVADLVLTALTPLALDVALTVSDELINQAEHADALRATHVQRAKTAADHARRRYLAVDPANRMVAEALEADWNTTLREVTAATDDYQRAKTAATALDEQHRDRVRALAADLPALWKNPATPMRERKRLIRLLITDVTLTRGDEHITAGVRLPGGQAQALTLPIPLNAWQRRSTDTADLQQLNTLLDTLTYAQAADHLNAAGSTSGDGHRWDGSRVAALVSYHQIRTRHQRLRDHGLLTLPEIAQQLTAHPMSIKRWHKLGLLTGEQADDRGIFLYHPGQTRPSYDQVTHAGQQLGDHRSGRRNPHRTSGRPRTVTGSRHTPDTTT